MIVFRSAIDWWYWAVIAACAALLCVVTLDVVAAGETVGFVAIAISALLVLGLPLWLAASTSYTVTSDQLLVRSGPFRWRVQLSDITSISPSRSALSAPALSLTRLEIRYGAGQSLLVSPKDKDAFIKALSVAP